MTDRNLGLDLLRCFAIIGVVAFHSSDALPGRDLGVVMPVELFFGISGYLIAQMVVERFDGISSLAAFRAFMLNRWLRTLPLYWLLVAVQGIALIGTLPWRLTLQDALFLQNLWVSDQMRYGMSPIPIAWSLCIEEWFYLLCPLILLIAGRRSHSFWIGLGIGLILLALSLRLGRFLISDADGQLLQIYYYRMPTLMRPDVFVYGAATYFWRHSLFGRNWRRVAAALLGLALTALNVTLLEQAPNGFFVKILLPSLSPLAMALVIPWMTALRLAPHPWLQPVAAWLSKRTYAIYLTHFGVLKLCLGETQPQSWQLVVAPAAVLIVGELFYTYLERPILMRRPLSAPPSLRPLPAQ